MSWPEQGGDPRPANVRAMKPSLSALFLSLVQVLGVAAARPAVGARRPPNVVVILVDDLGGTDLGCYGSRFFETPNLDRLAREGLRFTQAYSACTVCSPTRAALLTGKYPARLHVTDWIPGHQRPAAKLRVPDWTMYLSPSERTLAEALSSAGYATASIGKWHLGGPEYFPEKHGFDRNVGGTHRGQPPSYFSPYKIETLPDGPAGEFLTDREAAEAVKFIRENRDRPFFLYLPHHAVHTPLMGKQTVVEKYRAKAKPGDPQANATYAALVESVDDSVGRLLKVLEEEKLAQDTVVVFTSDNGGLLRSTTNLGMRAGKGSSYEGGVRIPLIVRWPARVRPGRTSDTPAITMDLYPTLLEAAGVKREPEQVIDGRSLMPLLRGRGGLGRKALFWHYPHYHPGGATPYSAIRDGDLKLLEFYEDGRLELYDLKADPEEKRDLALERPEKAAELHKRLVRWRREVGAQDPTPNPDYKP